MSIPGTKEELLKKWYKRLRETQHQHYEAAKPLGNLNQKLGIPVVILTSVVGTSVFASLESNVSIPIKILVGLISVIAAVLSGLQTFLRFSERAETHRNTAAKAGIIRREIEQLLASPNIESISDDRLDKVRDQINKMSEAAPSVSDKVWRLVKRNYIDQQEA